MRRLFTVLIAFAATAASLTVVTGGEAVAKARDCGTGVSTKNTHDMDMDHGGSSMEQNCPVVADARRIPVTANDFSFSPARITIAAGENVTVALAASDVAHDVYVKGVGHVVHAKKGKTAQGGLRIKKAGTYKFWCTILGHKKQGMTGTITVTS